MKRKRLLIAIVAAAALILTTYIVATLRLCGAAYDIAGGDFRFRFCNMRGEFIAAIPTPNAQQSPRYSWRNLDGNKPTVQWLKFVTSLPPAVVKAQLTTYLQQSGFSAGEADANCTWWNRASFQVCVTATPSASSTGTDVVVTANLGMD